MSLNVVRAENPYEEGDIDNTDVVLQRCSRLDHPNYKEEHRNCINMQYAAIAKANGVDCVECLFDQPEAEGSKLVDALSVVAQPLAFLGASFMSSKNSYKINKAWADAYETGHKQCTSRYQSYLDYNTSIGANPILPTDAAMLNNTCNGNSYSGYAGYGGFMSNGFGGYYNPYLSQGYSSGFMNGYFGAGATGFYGQGVTNPFLLNNNGLNGIYGGGLGLNAGFNVNGSLNTSSSGIFNTSEITPAFNFGQ